MTCLSKIDSLEYILDMQIKNSYTLNTLIGIIWLWSLVKYSSWVPWWHPAEGNWRVIKSNI